MILHVLRALFILIIGAAGVYFIRQHNPVEARALEAYIWLTPAIALCVGVGFVCIDILAPRRKLAFFAGTFFGLVVGMIVAYGLSFIVELLVNQYSGKMNQPERDSLIQFINLILTCASCYLAISLILQTKDDFRFIIPYVEFTKAIKGARPIVLDTSVLIDGRIVDVVNTGIVESQVVVPQFVIDELQMIADSGDKLKRNRGRRGLDVLQKLRNNPKVDVALYDAAREHSELGVDQKLVALAKEVSGRILTNDFNLNKVAQLRGVDVINLNELANAMKPAVLPGEKMTVRLIKAGEDSGQGVGYLDDGTMVVVEGGRAFLNKEVEFLVTNTRQTSAGKMIFGRISGPEHESPSSAPPASNPRPSPRPV
jgi:uncharacterized protein YacL